MPNLLRFPLQVLSRILTRSIVKHEFHCILSLFAVLKLYAEVKEDMDKILAVSIAKEISFLKNNGFNHTPPRSAVYQPTVPCISRTRFVQCGYHIHIGQISSVVLQWIWLTFRRSRIAENEWHIFSLRRCPLRRQDWCFPNMCRSWRPWRIETWKLTTNSFDLETTSPAFYLVMATCRNWPSM